MGKTAKVTTEAQMRARRERRDNPRVWSQDKQWAWDALDWLALDAGYAVVSGQRSEENAFRDHDRAMAAFYESRYTDALAIFHEHLWAWVITAPPIPTPIATNRPIVFQAYPV